MFGPVSGGHFNPVATFAGIAPASVPAFIAMQLIGLVVGVAITLALYPDAGTTADDVVVPHRQ